MHNVLVAIEAAGWLRRFFTCFYIGPPGDVNPLVLNVHFAVNCARNIRFFIRS